MTKKDYIIGVDMDDTIENLMDAWVAYLNNKYGTTVKSSDIIEWEVYKFFPTLTDQQIYEPLYNEEFWKTVKPKEDAQKYLKKLYDEGYTIYIVSCSHYASVHPKVENCLLKYFPFINWRNLIFLKNKQLLNLDVLIDDYPKNLVHGIYQGILIDRPYNQDFNEQDYHIVRVTSWSEIYDLITDWYGLLSGDV